MAYILLFGLKVSVADRINPSAWAPLKGLGLLEALEKQYPPRGIQTVLPTEFFLGIVMSIRPMYGA